MIRNWFVLPISYVMMQLVHVVPDKGMVQAGDIKEANSFTNAFSFGDRTRSFLKVQDGCDYKCSFCTIPLAGDKIQKPVKWFEETVEGIEIVDF